MNNCFAMEAEMIDYVYDLDKVKFRIFTFDRNIYSIVLFKCESSIFLSL